VIEVKSLVPSGVKFARSAPGCFFPYRNSFFFSFVSVFPPRTVFFFLTLVPSGSQKSGLTLPRSFFDFSIWWETKIRGVSALNHLFPFTSFPSLRPPFFPPVLPPNENFQCPFSFFGLVRKHLQAAPSLRDRQVFSTRILLAWLPPLLFFSVLAIPDFPFYRNPNQELAFLEVYTLAGPFIPPFSLSFSSPL